MDCTFSVIVVLVQSLSHVRLFVTHELQSARLFCPQIIQSGILEWAAISFCRGSSQPWDQIHVSRIGRQILYHLSHQRSPARLKSDQLFYLSCQRTFNFVDFSLLFSLHFIIFIIYFPLLSLDFLFFLLFLRCILRLLISNLFS